jgi:hypothetical protein
VQRRSRNWREVEFGRKKRKWDGKKKSGRRWFVFADAGVGVVAGAVPRRNSPHHSVLLPV